jgi:hypothetical protein
VLRANAEADRGVAAAAAASKPVVVRKSLRLRELSAAFESIEFGSMACPLDGRFWLPRKKSFVAPAL